MPQVSISQQDAGQRLESLLREHSALKERVKEIASHSFLTPDQQVELTQLKKLKLQKKDLIAQLQRVV
jgi:uncharacterized protein YdcH (DUF465 family)